MISWQFCINAFQASLIFLCFAMSNSSPVEAGGFIFAGEANGVDVITHPKNYNGTGGEVTVSVCIDPASVNAAEMVIPVRNIVSVMNGFVPKSPNLILGTDNDIPAGQIDFESLTLHEFGHCLSLSHVNLATESGVSTIDRDYTKSTDGSDNTHNLGIGLDGVRGSGDDIRGDDINLHHFETGVNNPFLRVAKADGTNYTRNVANLPAGDLYPANADRNVGPLFATPNTEAVMQQGQFFDEDQRGLQSDDIATLMLGGTGLDETVGGTDDYTTKLVYAGLTDTCDIVVKSDTGTSFASCASGGTFLNANHVAITSGLFRYNPTAVTWFFNPVLACDDIMLDYAHDAMIAHEACGTVTTGTGFEVGSTGKVNLTGTSVILGSGTKVMSGGALSIQNPP